MARRSRILRRTFVGCTQSTDATGGIRLPRCRGGLLGLIALAIGGCAAQSRTRVFSPFFEAVGDPTTTQPAMSAAIRATHQPFASQQCAVCHVGQKGTDRWILSATRDGVCMNCHQGVTRQYGVMHSPVASQQCLWCHAPHDSVVGGLLRESAPNLCVQCHQQVLLSQGTPAHVEGRADCLSCHLAHGGTDHRMLRPLRATESMGKAVRFQ